MQSIVTQFNLLLHWFITVSKLVTTNISGVSLVIVHAVILGITGMFLTNTFPND